MRAVDSEAGCLYIPLSQDLTAILHPLYTLDAHGCKRISTKWRVSPSETRNIRSHTFLFPPWFRGSWSVCRPAHVPSPLTYLILSSDIPTFEAHVARLAGAGVGPLVAGSMGEALHLSHSERVKLIHAARKALDTAGFSHIPIIAGTGAGSTRETIELTNEAAAAGADYAIVIASGYFAGAWANNRTALKAFWVEVSEKSPIPVMIYNCVSFFPVVLHFPERFARPWCERGYRPRFGSYH